MRHLPLNPVADLIETRFSRVALDRVLDTRRFDFAKAQSHPLWYQELYGFAEHRPETEQYGIRSFVYRARQPFHPQKFYDFLNISWPGVIRAKGCFWLATRPEWAGELSQAGALSQHQAAGFWWTSVARDQWPDNPEWRQRLDRDRDSVYGDRRQELVFIGATAEMDETNIRHGLDSCLVGSAAAPVLDEEAWQSLPDPFPVWERGESGEET